MTATAVPPMPDDATLRAEADRLLSAGLRRVLDAYGRVHIMGSYALRLMVWRDLDIHIVSPDLNQRAFFGLGANIAEVLLPHRMHFRNELTAQTAGLPRGLYWGVYLGDERRGGWKIDVWATDDAGFQPTSAFQHWIEAALTDDVRATILRIKSAVWNHPDYRRGFSSADVYRGVIDANVKDLDGFFGYLQRVRSGASE